jgi:hypothetical protein
MLIFTPLLKMRDEHAPRSFQVPLDRVPRTRDILPSGRADFAVLVHLLRRRAGFLSVLQPVAKMTKAPWHGMWLSCTTTTTSTTTTKTGIASCVTDMVIGSRVS